MTYWIIDIEVYPEWFCIVLKESNTTKYVIATTDNLEPLLTISNLMGIKDNVLTGFNIKSYDLSILYSIIGNYQRGDSPIKISKTASAMSQAIVVDHQRFPYPYSLCTFTDLSDDLLEGLSLKEYESNRGLPIKETTVPFGKINLTQTDKDDIIKYCIADVDATDIMLLDRHTYIESKITLANRFNMSPYFALKRTDPSLVSDILVRNKNYDKSFLGQPITYVIPDTIKSYIYKQLPLWVIEKFLHYESFDSVEKTFNLFNNTITIGRAGLHNTHILTSRDTNKVLVVEPKDGYVNVFADAKSYFPHLICIFNYQSRAITDFNLYPQVLAERMNLGPAAKTNPDVIAISGALKLLLNSAGGAMFQEYLAVYDPEQYIRRVFTGQLLLLALCNELYVDSHADIIQGNTDGIAFRIPYANRQTAYNILKQWEQLTHIPLDMMKFKGIYQNNVNNYVMTFYNKPSKVVGSWLDYEIDPFHNIYFPIITKAMYEYLINHTPIYDTITKETNPMMFLYTVKRGPTFENTVLVSNRGEQKLGKVNRVYASNSPLAGTLYKVQRGAKKLVPSCPKRARTLNEIVYTMPDDIDIGWYIKTATEAIMGLIRIDLP